MPLPLEGSLVEADFESLALSLGFDWSGEPATFLSTSLRHRAPAAASAALCHGEKIVVNEMWSLGATVHPQKFCIKDHTPNSGLWCLWMVATRLDRVVSLPLLWIGYIIEIYHCLYHCKSHLSPLANSWKPTWKQEKVGCSHDLSVFQLPISWTPGSSKTGFWHLHSLLVGVGQDTSCRFSHAGSPDGEVCRVCRPWFHPSWSLLFIFCWHCWKPGWHRALEFLQDII
jgi:hypothetical protein